MSGRQWLMAWEDGQRGVFRVDSTQEVKVSKTHELMDSDDPALVDNLMSDMQQHYVGELCGANTKVFNDPNMTRASQLLGIGDLLCDEDDRPVATPAKAPLASSSSRPMPQPAAPSVAGGVAPMDVDDSTSSADLLDLLRPQQPRNHVKTKAKGASKAKPKPVAKVKAKALPPVPRFSESSGRSDEQPQPGPPAKRPRTSQIEVMDPSTEVPGAESEQQSPADQAWHDDYMQSLTMALNFCPRDGDQDFKSDVAERVKTVNNLLTKVRARARSIKRRTGDNRDAAVKDADHLETTTAFYASFLRNMQKSTSTALPCGFGDDCYSQFNQLVGQNAIFGVEVVKRVSRALVLDDIRYQRWPKLLDTTWPLIKQNTPPAESDAFFAQQVSVALQKLLRGIAIEKVPFSITASFPINQIYALMMVRTITNMFISH